MKCVMIKINDDIMHTIMAALFTHFTSFNNACYVTHTVIIIR